MLSTATPIVSVPAVVVIAIPEPADNVKVSEELSATTLDCPATAIVENALTKTPETVVISKLYPLYGALENVNTFPETE